jgi:hypothetical protein
LALHVGEFEIRAEDVARSTGGWKIIGRSSVWSISIILVVHVGIWAAVDHIEV